jgi:hypothetical protein
MKVFVIELKPLQFQQDRIVGQLLSAADFGVERSFVFSASGIRESDLARY